MTPPGDLENIELAAASYVTGLQFAPDLYTFGVVRVGVDVADLISEHGAVVAVTQAGGARVTWQTVARLSLDIYAGSYEHAWRAQNTLDAHLGNRRLPSTDPDTSIRFDAWRNEAAAVERPYPAPLTVITSVWRVSTRNLPA